MRTIKDVYAEMKELVDDGSVYQFSSIEDGEVIEGKPVDYGTDLFVELTKDLPYAKKGTSIAIDIDEFQMMEVKKVG